MAYHISSGVISTGISLYDDSMHISSGGVANSTTVSYYGHMYISSGGVANSTKVIGWGSIDIDGVANDTMVNGGAVVLFQLGTFIVGGQQAAILSALEPITSVVISAILAEVVFGLRNALGTTFVIASTILIGVYNFKKAKLTVPKGQQR